MNHPFLPHPKSPTKPSMKRRARFHNYSEPGVYMITMVIAHRRPCFGTLETVPYPYIKLNALGKAASEVVYNAYQFYPNVRVKKVCIMPDHIHFIIAVIDQFPPTMDGRAGHLGYVVNGIKSGCRKATRCLYPDSDTLLFEKGYHDRIVMGDRQFDTWTRYLDDNPRRLALKLQNPDYFTVMTDIDICCRKCQITGNRFLLNNPDKMPVIVHRDDDDDTFARKKAIWLSCGERGGVLVSASIAMREKEVMREAMDRGYYIILLRENGFPAQYKPSGEAFEACVEGNLLQVSPWDHHSERCTITRGQCLYLNDFAIQIAADTTWY